jgi:hypothetical protein
VFSPDRSLSREILFLSNVFFVHEAKHSDFRGGRSKSAAPRYVQIKPLLNGRDTTFHWHFLSTHLVSCLRNGAEGFPIGGIGGI